MAEWRRCSSTSPQTTASNEPGEEVADEAEVEAPGDVVLAVDLRVTDQGQPGGADARVALGGEDEVEVEVGVDGPERRGVQLLRQPVVQAVVDVQVEVEARARNARE